MKKKEFLKTLYPGGRPSHKHQDYVAVHKEGAWHGTVHIWIVINRKNVLFQKRSHGKENFGGYYDISCAGHVREGEADKTAALRELAEELELRPAEKDLIYLTRIKSETVINGGKYRDREWASVYLLKLEKLPALKLPTAEVDSIRLLGLDDLATMISERDNSFVPHGEEYNYLLTYLRQLPGY